MSLLSYQSPLEGRKLFHGSGGLLWRAAISPSSVAPGLGLGLSNPTCVIDYGEPLRCAQAGSPLSLLFASCREVPPLDQATTLSYSNQQDLDPVHGLLGPSWSPIPRTASSRMQLLVICLLLQPLPEFQVINLVESRCIPARQRAEVERLCFNNKAAPSTL